MLIAVASTTGTEIDQHFGHAERFLVFKYRKGNPEQVAEVEVDKYCSMDPDHPFRPMPLKGIAEALHECRAIVTAMIGERPKLELEQLGFKVISTTGPVEPALKMAHDAVCQSVCGGRNLADETCEYRE
jgi:predicted Fe-Mo cluster-binding NifX family protein